MLPLLLWSASALAATGDSLPFPEQRSGSTAGPTIKESNYAPRPSVSHLPKDAPNILIIMLDDVGPAIPDVYGGDIRMPGLAKVAKTGISYNRFHNVAMCSPTRASLLTGRNHHRVGAGQISEFANDWPGYSGRLPTAASPIAKVLGYYGYDTSAFGKWHNTPSNETTALGPFDRWPTGQVVGFNYFYGFLAGESSQYEPAIVENTKYIATPHRKGYHFTEDMTDQAINWMRKQRALVPNRPFMMYWAPGAAHGPHHVAKEWADKYKGKFDQGWDVMRERIFARQKAMGWIPQDTKLTPRAATLQGWNEIPQEQREFQTRLMEVYAGFVEHTDTEAARLIDELDRLGIRDNTLIFYILSDNGSSAEGQMGTISELLAQNSLTSEVADHIRTMNELGGLDVLGSAKADNMYHAGWAWAGSTPFQATKLVASHFGGTRTPMAVSWPKKIAADSKIRNQFHHVNDIVPTIYEAVGIKAPKTVDGVPQTVVDGISLAYTFKDPAAKDRKTKQYFEIMGSRALYQDGYIASVFGPRIPWVQGAPDIANWDPSKDTWELYDITKDFSQADDIAAANPSKVNAMKAEFLKVAKDNKAFPIGGGLWSIINPQYAPKNPATEFNYSADVTPVLEASGPKVGSRSNLLVVDAELNPGSAGVVYALGGFSGGLSLWIDNGVLNYEYNLFEIERTRIKSSQPLPMGPVRIEVETRQVRVTDKPTGLTVVIRINGVEVAKGSVPRAALALFTANDAFDIGRDSYSPVALDYYDRAPFAFNSKLGNVYIKYLE
jgi:arylsulfatase